MCLSSCAIRGTLGLVRLSRSIHLLADGGGAVVDEGGIDLRLGVCCSPNGGVRRVHAVLQVLLERAPVHRFMCLRRGQALKTPQRLCPQLAQLSVDVVGAGVLGWVREDSACRDRVGRVEEGLGGLASKARRHCAPYNLSKSSGFCWRATTGQ